MADDSGGIQRGPSWWRFDQYEIVDGTHIAPAEGAELVRYNPMEHHAELWSGRTGEQEAPYVKLARLNLKPFDVEGVTEWCSEFGLLGILPHRTLEVRFWPRWGGMGSGVDGLGTDRGINQEVYRWGRGSGRDMVHGSGEPLPEDHDAEEDLSPLRTNGSNDADEHPDRAEGNEDGQEGPDAPVQIGPPEPGQLLRPDEVENLEEVVRVSHARRPVTRPGVQTVPLHGERVEDADLVQGYGQFFPRRDHVPAWVEYHTHRLEASEGNVFWTDKAEAASLELERASYPFPDEEAFLRAYGEPLPLVREYVLQLQAVYELWQRARAAESFEELEDALYAYEDPLVGKRPFGEFQASLRSISPYADPEPSEDGYTWPAHWEIPSLYAALNLMMYRDFAYRDAYAKQCQECGKPFVTRRENKKFCSNRCGNRYRVRKHREG